MRMAKSHTRTALGRTVITPGLTLQADVAVLETVQCPLLLHARVGYQDFLVRSSIAFAWGEEAPRRLKKDPQLTPDCALRPPIWWRRCMRRVSLHLDSGSQTEAGGFWTCSVAGGITESHNSCQAAAREAL